MSRPVNRHGTKAKGKCQSPDIIRNAQKRPDDINVQNGKDCHEERGSKEYKNAGPAEIFGIRHVLQFMLHVSGKEHGCKKQEYELVRIYIDEPI